MANPTTNYSWPMPTSTDLVTDLPADFALFGQPVDTTLKNLNPQTTTGALAYRSATSNVNTALTIGSTGQVLTVAAGVPSWATPAASPLTTKGDLFTFSTVDARLPVAANFAFLTADSAATTGNAWDISAWTSFSPTITSYTGTLTTATAAGKYKRVGKICVARYQWLVTTNGTGATRIVLTLPFTAATMTGNDGQVGAAREDQVSGKMCMAFQDSGSATTLFVRTYDNLYPAGNGYGGQVQFIYEVA